MPTCPNCGKEIKTIYTSRQLHLVHDGTAWKREVFDQYETYQCPECLEEFDGKDLDKLGVSNEIR